MRPSASSRAGVADQNGSASAGVPPAAGGEEQGGGRKMVFPAALRLALRPRQRRLPRLQQGRHRGVGRRGATGEAGEPRRHRVLGRLVAA